MLSTNVTSYALIAMKVVVTNVAFVLSNNIKCMIFTMPQLEELKRCFLKRFLIFQQLKHWFQIFIINHWTAMNRKVINSSKLHIFMLVISGEMSQKKITIDGHA